MKTTPEIKFPEFFEDEIAKAKGWVSGIRIQEGCAVYIATFYDPIRLAQDIESELEDGSIFAERNLVVLPHVDRNSIEEVVEKMAMVGVSKYLTADADE